MGQESLQDGIISLLRGIVETAESHGGPDISLVQQFLDCKGGNEESLKLLLEDFGGQDCFYELYSVLYCTGHRAVRFEARRELMPDWHDSEFFHYVGSHCWQRVEQNVMMLVAIVGKEQNKKLNISSASCPLRNFGGFLRNFSHYAVV